MTPPTICGALTTELWDFTDGATLVDITIENVITFNPSSAGNQEVAVQTSDGTKVRNYPLRWKVYLQAYTSVVIVQDFDILVQNPCLVTTFSLLATNPLLQTSPIYSYSVANP